MAIARPATDEGVDPHRFALAPAPEDVAVRKLLFEGRSVADVAGVDVVAHYEIEGIGWLVIADHDSPFEEVIEIHLLDREFVVLDAWKAGGPYVPGSIRDIQRTGPANVTFTFPDRDRAWTVVVERRDTGGWLRGKTRWLSVTSEARADPLDSSPS